MKNLNLKKDERKYVLSLSTKINLKNNQNKNEIIINKC